MQSDVIWRMCLQHGPTVAAFELCCVQVSGSGWRPLES